MKTTKPIRPVTFNTYNILRRVLHIYRHIQIYPDIFSQTTRHIQILVNPDIFKTLVYSEPWQIEYQRYIENLGIFRILASSQPEHRYIYSEFWYIQNARIFRTLECVVKIFNILYEINLNFFIRG